MAAANDNAPEAEAERERLAAVQRALNGENPYQDLLDQGINPAFFGVPRPSTIFGVLRDILFEWKQSKY